MGKLYERDEIYDLLESKSRDAITRKHYETVFSGKTIRTLLDVSIGTGSMTLPIADLGIAISGSDLSQNMLDRCRKKCETRNIPATLKCSDFRTVAREFDELFDCVASTGNSLGYVANEDVLKTLEQMDALVKPGGYLYLDLRNWDMILEKKPRYYLYNPSFIGETRVNLMQFWDYLPDGTVDFNLLYTFEQNNRIMQKEHFAEHYIPIPRQLIVDKLHDLGYQEMETMHMPAHFGSFDPVTSEWYCIIARKAY